MIDKKETREVMTREAWEQYVVEKSVYEKKQIKQIYDAKSMKEAIEKMLDHYRQKYDHCKMLFTRNEAGVVTFGFYNGKGEWYPCC